jgi:hypothetical protein
MGSHMANALTMFRVFPDRNVNVALVKDRSPDDMISC